MFDSFLARFVYQCNPNNTPLVRTLCDNEVIYLVAFPAFRDGKKTLLSTHQVIDALRKTDATTLRSAAFLNLLNVNQINVGLMPCKLKRVRDRYVTVSPGNAAYVNTRVSVPNTRMLAHNYNDDTLYTWFISQRDEHNALSEYPAYELEYVLYQMLHYRAVFTTLLPFMLKGVRDVFTLTPPQSETLYATLNQLRDTITTPMALRH